jgi:hypothetical protein
MFVRKARAYPSGAPKRSSPLGYALGLTDKHKARLERLAVDNRSSLLRTFVNYGPEKFCNIGPGVNFISILGA